MGSGGEPRSEGRDLRWNRGGWFGAQLGATLWLGILGVLLLRRDALAGSAALACFALPNVVGWAIWQARARLDVRRSLVALIATTGLCALAATAALDVRGIDRLPGTGNVGVGALYWVLLVYPLVLLSVWARGGRRTAGAVEEP